MIAGHRHRRVVPARTRTDARLLLAQFVTELGGASRDAWDATVADLLLVHEREARWAVTTRTLWDTLTGRLPAWFVDLRVGDVRPKTLARLWNELGPILGDHQTSRLHQMLGAAWRTAMRHEWITVSPFTAVRPPTPARREISPPDPAVVRKVLDVGLVDWQRAAFTIAATTGARRGEICGLRWDDLDDGRLWIRRAVVYTAADGVLVKDTKTGEKGRRRIRLDLRTLDRIETHRARLEAAGVPTAAGWMFPASYGPIDPVRPDNLTQAWDRACHRAGVPPVRLNDLRHFAITQMLAAGVDVRTVAGRVGHANPATTLNRYAAWIPARDDAAAELLGDLVG